MPMEVLFQQFINQSINTNSPMVARVNNTDMITFARIVAQETRIAVMDGVLAGRNKNKINRET